MTEVNSHYVEARRLLSKTPSAETPVQTRFRRLRCVLDTSEGRGLRMKPRASRQWGADTIACFQDKSSAHDYQLLHAETSIY